MTRSADLTAINCTSCGAGLDVLGGGRVIVHICPYCGTELDAQDDYKTLRNYSDLPRPDTPFQIGMTGELLGVDWTIIGTLGMREDWQGRSWEWAEHQLYSPTHGYGFLTVEDGHTTFSRRERRTSRPTWIGTAWVETAENRPMVKLRGDTFVYFQTSTARVTFAEGEFNWAPSIGDVSTTVSAMSKDQMLDFSDEGEEQIVYRSIYVDPTDTLTTFGLEEGALHPRGVHALTPYAEGSNLAFLRYAGLVFAVVCGLIAAVLSGSPGNSVLSNRKVPLNLLPQTLTFDIDKPGRLARIKMSSDVANSWAYVEFEVTDPEDETLFEVGRQMERYHGVQNGEGWSEGSGRANLTFLPAIPGTYSLNISASETGLWGQGRREPSRVVVSVRQGLSSGLWMAYLAAGFLVVAAVPWGLMALHRHRRWRQSDWVEEDDD